MSSPLWLKWLVLAWVPLTLGVLHTLRDFELEEYVSEASQRHYFQRDWVKSKWQTWLNRLDHDSALTVFHVTRTDCHCNYLVEKHLVDLGSMPGVKIVRLEDTHLETQPPSFPTLVIAKDRQLIYFGAYGSGPACQNDALAIWVRQQLDKTDNTNDFVLNTMAKGCFCPNLKRES